MMNFFLDTLIFCAWPISFLILSVINHMMLTFFPIEPSILINPPYTLPHHDRVYIRSDFTVDNLY